MSRLPALLPSCGFYDLLPHLLKVKVACNVSVQPHLLVNGVPKVAMNAAACTLISSHPEHAIVLVKLCRTSWL